MTDRRRLYLESLGCSKNLVDSEAALGLLLGAGYLLVDDPAEAELLLVNTCAFIETARQQSVERILELAAVKSKTGARLAVIGCLGQRYADTLRQEIPEIDLVAGVGRQAELAAALEKLWSDGGAAADLAAGGPVVSFAGMLRRPLLTPPHLAYVKLGEGCSRACAFCAIPAIRGRFRSRPPEDIEAEVRTLAAGGVREINLISQDSGYYGRDAGAAALLPLMRRLSAVEELRWIRLFYLHPVLLELEDLLAIYALPRVAPYLDMPIQHASDEVLRRMRRGHGRQRLARLFSALRRERPDLALRTTVLVGTPGESEEEFQELLDFLEEHPFDKLGVFGYSREEGTPMAAAAGAVAARRIAQRVERVQVAQMVVSEALGRAQIGRRMTAVVEALPGAGDGLPAGRSLDPLASAPFPDATAALRTERDAYEVDGHLFLTEPAALRLGQWVEAEVTAADVYDLAGRLAGAEGLP